MGIKSSKACEVLFHIKGLTDEQYTAIYDAIVMCEKLEDELEFEELGYKQIPFVEDSEEDDSEE